MSLVMCQEEVGGITGRTTRACGGRKLLLLLAVTTLVASVSLHGSASGSTGSARARTGEPELIQTVKAGDPEAVRRLLAQGVDVNAPQGDGATALHWAVHRDDRETADLLIRAEANVNTADDHGVTPLSLACLNGSAMLVDRLLQAGANPNAARSSGETPLMTAARVGKLDVVRSLLVAGADVTAREASGGQTALMLAVAENHTDVARVLLKSGAGASTRSKNGFTPLLFAAQQGNLELARSLLAAGADVNESAPDGIAGDTNARAPFKRDTDASALLVAIDSGQPETAMFLLEQGADPHHNGAGRTALHSASQQAMPDVVSALLAHGADPNIRLERRMPLLSRYIRLDNGLAPDPIGATPFWLAASYGDVEIMRILVGKGADPLMTSNDGTTPLMVAAGADSVEGQDKYGRRSFGDSTPLQETALEAVKLCLELGNDINATNEDDQTALHGAVYLGGTLLVPFLVEHGASINAINKRGQTPWTIASQGEYRAGSFYTHKETAQVLEELGADTSLGSDLGSDFQQVLRERDLPEQ